MKYARRVQRIINKIGTSITLRTVASTYNASTLENVITNVDTALVASIRHYKPQEIAGLIQNGDREVRIAAVDIPMLIDALNKEMERAEQCPGNHV